ncbi:general secretion pathway protein GspK [Bradyrhizobium sp. CCGUVB14]|uniref:general secretion pathway protein GspK n=1 Tax=Bradyrhizobium sp. CCGUVB14 TaxID=2949628 RepID=UPI0020B29C3E|nr:type II secretion system protein GspK [Bradyrhizobium sp. CCGUVB14]MCP3445159.1 general secretion pathway protein GspK [Bradyrhizobium sp. CCGUVB14]
MTKTSATIQGSRSGQRGFIVVAALWLLAALAALALVSSAYMTQSAISLAALDAPVQLGMISSAGIEMTAYRLSAPAAVSRPTHGGFAFRLANASVTIEYQAESARINLNMAPQSMISGLFSALGVDADTAGQLANRVVAWRSAPRHNGQDSEDALYVAAGLNYLPRHAPFSSVDELALVLGAPATLLQQARPYLTVYSGTAAINVLDAAPQVISALPEMSSTKLDAFLNQRDSLPSTDPEFVLGALGGRVAGASVAGSDAYRVRMQIILPDGRKSISEGVIMLSGPGAKTAYRVFTWRDEIDPATGAAQR